ncbi:MAG: hypothetical protein SFT68_03845 [Rickettsiaceae bacterium]|nr:hypothetical protein [Rickettsiaceae bacterium]
MKFFRFLIFICVTIYVCASYMRLSGIDDSIKIEVNNLIIDTWLSAVVILFLVTTGVILFANSIFTLLFNSIGEIKSKLNAQRAQENISKLLESALLLGINERANANKLITGINTHYLDNSQKGYYELIKAIAAENAPTISLYMYNQYPGLKIFVAKKLADIELKLGNLEKALEYARLYYLSNPENESIHLIMAKIYCAMQNWHQVDSTILSINHKNCRNQIKEEFSSLYLEAAKAFLKVQDNSSVLDYCGKSLEQNPSNYKAAELFAEVASLQKNYELVNKVLLGCFKKNPNFNLFLLIRKFTDYNNLELYKALCDISDVKEYVDLFLAISCYLNLQEKQKEILDLVS